MPTIRDALQDAKRRIAPISASASLDAQLLLAEILGVGRAHVIAHPEKPLTPDQAAQYEAWVARRERGEPVAYLLGRRAFYDRELIVTPDVLIPRPETEHLIEAAFERLQAGDRVVDVGTGSGAIAVTLAANAPVTVYATDASQTALTVAQRNAAANGVDVSFYQGDLLQPLIERGVTVNMVAANLPYIATDEMRELAVSRHEPHLALDGGPDGLDLIRRLIRQIRESAVCTPGAALLLEIGAGQGAATANLLREGFQNVEIIKDYAGHDRVVRAVKHP